MVGRLKLAVSRSPALMHFGSRIYIRAGPYAAQNLRGEAIFHGLIRVHFRFAEIYFYHIKADRSALSRRSSTCWPCIQTVNNRREVVPNLRGSVRSSMTVLILVYLYGSVVI